MLHDRSLRAIFGYTHFLKRGNWEDSSVHSASTRNFMVLSVSQRELSTTVQEILFFPLLPHGAHQ